jgi:nitrogen fixation/metabolism regulation signal transduction histidine kinase
VTSRAQFIEKQKLAIGNAIGEAKANALIDLLNGVIANMEQEKIDVKKSLNEQLNIISHIQEILNIQRQYVKGQSSERMPVNLRSIINDSTVMLLASFDKKGVEITSDIPIKVPAIKGDRTKLMQVILNLLKNGVESVFLANVTEKSVHIELLVTGTSINIIITDNGLGFEGISGDHFFEKGVTSKPEGTGLGLANCKSIIESHNGTIHLKSKGAGLGATATIAFEIE